jgi:hypothetical protein
MIRAKLLFKVARLLFLPSMYTVFPLRGIAIYFVVDLKLLTCYWAESSDLAKSCGATCEQTCIKLNSGDKA